MKKINPWIKVELTDDFTLLVTSDINHCGSKQRSTIMHILIRMIWSFIKTISDDPVSKTKEVIINHK